MSAGPMNAERLLAHYEKIADAPDAIARLRRFVLDLAVRGKLVPQDASDEPASELLKRIAKEKARLVKAGEIRKPKVLADVEEPPFDLPQNWCWTPIREVTSDRGQEIPQSTFTYIDVTAINKEAGIVAEPKVLEASEAPSRARKITRKGDVIYSCVRPYLLNVAVIECDFDPQPIASTAFAILNGHGLVIPRYIWIVLRSPFMVECVEENQRGQAYPAINDADFAVLPFPLPPLAEQQRIVAKVDELMGLCERLEAARGGREAVRDRLAAASLARLNAPDPGTFQADARFALDALPALTTRPDQIKALRQTILNLAVRGKLVEQDPTDETASELLKRIAAEKAGNGKRQKELPEIDAEELGELPPNWSAVPLIALGTWAIGSGFPKNEQGQTDGPYFFLKVSDMNLPENNKFITTANNTIDDEAAMRMRAAIHPPGTIIFPKIGGAIATNKRRILTRGSAIDNNCLGITFASDIVVEWAYLLMTTLDFTRYQAGTAVPALQQGTLAGIPVGLPPLAEQHRIVAKVDALMALCDRLEAALITADTTRARLLEALLHEALEPAAEAVTEAAE
ncbi:MAG: restriction endonuclease subunit S [Aquamicrobium sp.]|uniref:restriction endonuclease subunit S n=1 Tax=Aquamicrobium sp. TaxID=1872579 RepID=UPI00349E4F88|nr:restriction endonuclease subunit S [Aquamicrobium sp.]